MASLPKAGAVTYEEWAPQLAIEVLSPSESRKQISGKLRDYESIGTDISQIWPD